MAGQNQRRLNLAKLDESTVKLSLSAPDGDAMYTDGHLAISTDRNQREMALRAAKRKFLRERFDKELRDSATTKEINEALRAALRLRPDTAASALNKDFEAQFQDGVQSSAPPASCLAAPAPTIVPSAVPPAASFAAPPIAPATPTPVPPAPSTSYERLCKANQVPIIMQTQPLAVVMAPSVTAAVAVSTPAEAVPTNRKRMRQEPPLRADEVRMQVRCT